ncbi:hypothetical protein O181_096396 [Austropuccinia psidii MF-1]|uniref:Uncharacterized protein n=1 Tax=Austropuccinia psidii MF-1 TaxID=1389203 RepID=A0A9Q3J7B5_9BASI|nr:hypothetical protein [Austropuccinia psidii MF-1]
MAIKDPQDPKWPKPPMDTIFQSMASGNHKREPTQLPERFPPIEGKVSLSSMHRILKVPQVVHIWYNTPLCTIFAQQSNGDIFRTKLSDTKSIPKSITNLEGRFFSYSVWQFPGSSQKIIQAPQSPCPAVVGLPFSHQDYSKETFQRLSIFSISFKESSTQHSLDNSISPYRQ